MEPQIIQAAGLELSGIGIRTSNQNGLSIRDQGALWGRLMTEHFLDPVVKANQFIYGLYHSYEGDHTKPFGFALTAEAAIPPAGEAIHPTLERFSVPAGRYLVCTSRRGPPAEVIAEIWPAIWAWFADSDVQRAYQYDYEQYDAAELSGGTVVVKIYISIK